METIGVISIQGGWGSGFRVLGFWYIPSPMETIGRVKVWTAGSRSGFGPKVRESHFQHPIGWLPKLWSRFGYPK